MNDDALYKRIFLRRYLEYNENIDLGMENRLQSPTFDILRIASIFGLYDELGMMMQGLRFYSKRQWRDIVWAKAWELENQDWQFRVNLCRSMEHVKAISNCVNTLTWWQIGGMSKDMMVSCETMSTLICRASELKCDSYRFKNNPTNPPYCDLCTNFAIENAEHLLMHCPYFNDRREAMFNEINELEKYYQTAIIDPRENTFYMYTLLGKPLDGKIPEMMLYFYRIVAVNVHHVYVTTVKNREGVG